MALLTLFTSFFKIGLLSFGGGYAMIPFLQAETLSHNWMDMQQFTEIVAISQITPGAISINMATYVGYTQAGVLGAFVASFALCLPSFLLVSVITTFFVKFHENFRVKSVISILKPTVVGLIFAAAVTIGRLEFFALGTLDLKPVVASILAFIMLFKLKIDPFICIILFAVLGSFLL